MGSEAVASYRLESSIYEYRKEALRYSETDRIEEQRLRLYARIKVYDSANELIQEKAIVGDTTYFLSGPYAKSESAAIDDLVADTARRIVEAVSEEWQW